MQLSMVEVTMVLLLLVIIISKAPRLQCYGAEVVVEHCCISQNFSAFHYIPLHSPAFLYILCIYLYLSAFLCIFLHFTTFRCCISLHFFAFLCISLHFSSFISISLHFLSFLCIFHHFSAFYILDFRTIVRRVLSSYGRHFLY